MGLTAQFQKSLAIGQEGTWGVVGTIRNWIPFEKESFGLLEIPLKPVPQIWTRRDYNRTWQSAKVVKPSFDFVVEPEDGIGEVLKAALGTSSAAQFGTFIAYQHTFTVQHVAELPSCFLRVLEYGTFVYDYTGCRVNELMLTYAQNEVLKAHVAWEGLNRLAGTAQTGTYGTQQPFTQANTFQVLINGTAGTNIRNVSLAIKNNLSRTYTAGTQNLVGAITAQALDVTGDFVLLITDETEITKFLGKGTSRLQIFMQGGTFTSGTMKYELSVNLPNIEYSAMPIKDEQGLVAAAVSFRASVGTNALGTGQLVVTLLNSQASYN